MKTTYDLQHGTRFPLLVLALVIFSMTTKFNPVYSQTTAYYQLNFIYDTETTGLSDWGAGDITFSGSSGYKFLNLRVDTGCVIENMPVVSIEGVSITQTQRFWFPFADSGTVYTSLIVGLTFTDTLLTVPPDLTDTVGVGQFEYDIKSGSDGGISSGGKKNPCKGEKQKGGAPVVPAPAAPSHAGFPNQEAGTNECAPAAISNSLKYLNAVHPTLGLPLQAISIDTWGPSGSAGGEAAPPDLSRNGCSGQAC